MRKASELLSSERVRGASRAVKARAEDDRGCRKKVVMREMKE